MAIESDSPTDDLLVIHQGGGDYTAQPYLRSEESSWGSPTRLPQYASSMDTEGPHLTGVALGPRQKDFVIMAQGATKTIRLGRFQDLERVVEAIVHHRGGWLTVRRKDLARTTRFRIVFADCTDIWGKKAARSTQHPAHLVLVCKPYGYLPDMHVEERWETDTIAAGDWTSVGASSGVAVTGGALVASGGTYGAERAFLRAAEGYTYEDLQPEIDFSPGATLANFKAQVYVKYIDANNYLVAYVDDTGAQSRLRLDKVVAGVPTNLVNEALANRVAAANRHVLRARVVRNAVYVEYFRRTIGTIKPKVPGQLETPTADLTPYVLTAAEAALFGAEVAGEWGFGFTPIDATAKVHRVIMNPSQLGGPTVGVVSSPALLSVGPTIPGDAPAEVGAEFTNFDAAAVSSSWILAAAWEKPLPRNLVPNGSFAVSLGAVGTNGWRVAAVAGIIGAGTSVTRITTDAYSGDACAEVVTTGTAGSGVAAVINEAVRAGDEVNAKVRLWAPASTTQMVVGVGVSGDITWSAPVALQADRMAAAAEFTVTWRPMADRERPFFAVKTNAGTVTTFRMDAVKVWIGSEEPENENGGNAIFGIANATSSIGGLGGAEATNANAWLGNQWQVTNSEINIAVPYDVLCIPSAIQDGQIAVEVWARVYRSATGTLQLDANFSDEAGDSDTGAHAVWAMEFAPDVLRTTGTLYAGLNTVKLGTFAIPVSELRPQLFLNITLNATGAGITGGIAEIITVPALTRMCTDTNGTGKKLMLREPIRSVIFDGRLEKRREYEEGRGDGGYLTLMGGGPLRLPAQKRGEVLVWPQQYAPSVAAGAANKGLFSPFMARPLIRPRVAIHEAD